MNFSRDCIAAGGARERQPQSKWIVNGWIIPGGSDYEGAFVKEFYFEDHDIAKDLAARHSESPTMAYVYSTSFKDKISKGSEIENSKLC